MKSKTFTLTLVLLIGLVGCSDDDNGGTAPPTTGTVVINPQPEEIDAPWEVSGPAEYSADGNGQTTLRGRAPGDYTIVWGDVDDYETPPDETLSLAAGGTITFTGAYTEDGEPTPPPGFVYIPPGTFTMGSPGDEPGRRENEGPQHQVTITQGFYMAQHEVTEEWWYQVMGGAPAISRLPKVSVSWYMAVQFCNSLSIQDGFVPVYEIHGANGDVTWNMSANGYRLPTEAEWEYACRATATMAYHNDTNCLHSTTEANFRGDVHGQEGMNCPVGIFRAVRTTVGSFPSNEWDLFDMHGNAWEWVWCGAYRQYTEDAVVDPAHDVSPGAFRVIRGGYWLSDALACRSAYRNRCFPHEEYSFIGFRPVRTAFESP